jgi:hypothetical protein
MIIQKRQSKNPFIIESDKEIDSNHSSDNEFETKKNSKLKNNQASVNNAYVHSTNDLNKMNDDEKTQIHDKKDEDIEKI